MFNFDKTLLLGGDENSIEVNPRKSARAKKISIKISSHNGVELIIPKNTSAARALKFLYSKEDWIVNKSREIRETEQVDIIEGAKIPVQGKFYSIKHSGSLRGVTHLHGDLIVVSGPEESIARKVINFLKQLAKKEITSRAEIEAMKLGVNYKKITVRDTTSRWGSCSHNKNLSFSWRLILAPKEVLDYVVAHEISHLLEMNHSKNFWNIVESIYPDHQSPRKWLKENGQSLHMYK